jgi:uncharacterized protein YkwD
MLKHKRIYQHLLSILVLLLLGAVAGLSASEPLPGPPPVFPGKAEVATSSGLTPAAYLPLVVSPPAPPPWVDTQNKTAVQHYYLSEYLASDGLAPNWTGNHNSCNPGTTSPAFREAVLRRINYFRAMAGIPAVVGFNDTYNSKAQAAALMMSVNRALNHTPPDTSLCYTADGYSGASSSNLFLGVYGPASISGYVYDPGSNNYPVGHRRWILYPQTRYMGTGDLPPQNGYSGANALWVFDSANMWGPRPATREAFVAWPPPGYVPYQVVFPRWSFAYAGADFSNATVAMTRSGQPLGVSPSPVVNGFGENTLVWELSETIPQPPGGDISFAVSIQNVVINGTAQAFNYQVIVFNPNQ